MKNIQSKFQIDFSFNLRIYRTVTEIQKAALSEGMCVEVAIRVKNSSSTVAEMVVRR